MLFSVIIFNNQFTWTPQKKGFRYNHHENKFLVHLSIQEKSLLQTRFDACHIRTEVLSKGLYKGGNLGRVRWYRRAVQWHIFHIHINDFKRVHNNSYTFYVLHKVIIFWFVLNRNDIEISIPSYCILFLINNQTVQPRYMLYILFRHWRS